ncbi:hypothetical protein BV22DRAFT_1051487, partial [Leucogyrophana mollusca]
ANVFGTALLLGTGGRTACCIIFAFGIATGRIRVGGWVQGLVSDGVKVGAPSVLQHLNYCYMKPRAISPTDESVGSLPALSASTSARTLSTRALAHELSSPGFSNNRLPLASARIGHTLRHEIPTAHACRAGARRWRKEQCIERGAPSFPPIVAPMKVLIVLLDAEEESDLLVKVVCLHWISWFGLLPPPHPCQEPFVAGGDTS